ncbi:MAG: efflux RND transporter periplasmic adaptor subunit [Alphaproteobacteria bacterium]
MASAIFKPSRIVAVAIVVGAVLWIASGSFGPDAEETSVAEDAVASEERVLIQKVAVAEVEVVSRERQVVLSCVTEAENRAKAVARGAGVIIELPISRGDQVRAGDVIAVISDEGRSAALSQAQALLDQRLAEYEANKTLIDRGDAPRNRLPALEAAVAAGRAAVAAAQAEADRSFVKSPIDGTVDLLPALVGQAVQVGDDVAEIVDPDPMLAVGAIGEARRASVQAGQMAEIRFVDERKVTGEVNFVGLSADKATRTYRVETTMANSEAKIADGVTCEMSVALDPVEAVAIPRSALVFSDEGELGIRIVKADDRVQFLAVDILSDGRQDVWVTGIQGKTRVIVVGQDFVKSGDLVEPISAAATAEAAGPAS